MLPDGERTVAIDFDGTIHWYRRGWVDGSTYDPPTPGTREALEYLSKRYRLVVLTAEGRDLEAVRRYLTQYDLAQYISDVTLIKPGAVAYIDDRAIEFRGNWREVTRRL